MLAEFTDTRGFKLGRDLGNMDLLKLPGPRSKGKVPPRFIGGLNQLCLPLITDEHRSALHRL